MASAGIGRSGRRVQYAALPFRIRRDGTVEVRLITSRETRRWVIPKGWPMKGRTPAQAAARETFEEAGLLGTIARKPIGLYTYDKRLASRTVPCDVMVFPLKVKRQLRNWPERSQRFGFWFTIESAAAAVHESELKDLILAFGELMARKQAAKKAAAEAKAADGKAAKSAAADAATSKGKADRKGDGERAGDGARKGDGDGKGAGKAAAAGLSPPVEQARVKASALKSQSSKSSASKEPSAKDGAPKKAAAKEIAAKENAAKGDAGKDDTGKEDAAKATASKATASKKAQSKGGSKAAPAKSPS